MVRRLCPCLNVMMNAHLASNVCRPVYSGHGAMRENHYLDDGAYSAVQTIIEMVRQALGGQSKDIGAAILADFPEAVESKEYRLKVCVPMQSAAS